VPPLVVDPRLDTGHTPLSPPRTPSRNGAIGSRATASSDATRQPFYTAALKLARNFLDFEQASLDGAIQTSARYARGRLLDVGCGDKPYERLFAPHIDEYIGVEYQDTYAQSANARKGKADFVYSGDRLPFGDASFDTVLCSQVGEHVPDPRAFFKDLARVLKPSGRLIVTVPFSYRIHSAPNDFHRFTQYALREYARWLDLEIEVLEPRGGVWTVIGAKLTTHIGHKYVRIGADLQRIGGLGYEGASFEAPRYWVLPLAAPAMFAIAAAARVLDRLDPSDYETLGYLLIAKKPS
jgi:SAM-dependent methyltransferase